MFAINALSKRRVSMPQRINQLGLSLLELMIAMVLGLAVVGGAGKIFLSNTQAFRLQDEVSGLQQSSRIVMEMILADVRRAGLDIPAGAPVLGINGQNDTATVGAGNPGLLQNSDEILVAYMAPAAMTDCEGQNAAPGQRIANLYFIKDDNGLAALFCAGAVDAFPDRTKGTSLLRGVESFQIIYGLSPNEGNGYVGPIGYVPAPTGVGTNYWVGGVQIALLTRTENGIQGVQAPVNGIAMLYPTSPTEVPKATLETVTDGNGRFPVHRVFTGFAAIRNAAQSNFAAY